MKPLTIEGTPRNLGRFELVAELASGGMATVYLGRLGGAGGFQRFVAIKRLHSHLASDAEFVDMFLDEARLAARLHHPNVVPILEIGQSENDHGYYLVMEYVEGETLARLLNLSHQAGSPVPTNVTVRIFLDVLAGLHAAHELVGDDGAPLEIVHRDVSPQNVLIGVEGAAKITDFGVAHAADRLAHTRTGQLKGKFSYMAPEQALGKPVDRRADVFAVGTCLWEALACKRLFKGDSEGDTLEKVMRGVVPRLRALDRNIHPAIEEVVARALDRDCQRRFRSCAEFADALEAAAVKAGVLGAQRDVMTHVQRVLGPILVQQREAVRAWIVGLDQHRARDRDTGTNERGPSTRVDVPRTSGRRESAMRQEVTAAPRRQQPSQHPLMASADDAGLDRRSSADSSGSLAVAPMERSTVSAAPARSNSSMLPTFAIAGLVIAIGAVVGVSRLSAVSPSDLQASAEQRAMPHLAGATEARGGAPNLVPAHAPPPAPVVAVAAQTGTLSNATVPGTPPVPTTPLDAMGVPAPVPAPNVPPPLPLLGAGVAPVPTVSVTELPRAGVGQPDSHRVASSAPGPAAPRNASRVVPSPSPRFEPHAADVERPRPAKAERSESRGGDPVLPDDLGRNPYR